MTWSGATRAALTDQKVYPPTESGACRRGSPWAGARIRRARRALRLPAHARDHRRRAHAVRALRGSLSPRARAVRAADPRRRRALARLRRAHRPSRRWTRAGRTTRRCTRRSAASAAGRRCRASSTSAGAGPDGALFVGAPETVAAKIVATVEGLGLSRFDMKYSVGTLPHEQLMTSIELYGREVIPLVREQLAA